MKKPIQNAADISEPAFVAWGDDQSSREEAVKMSAESLTEYTSIDRSYASRRYSTDYSNLDSNTSGRPGLTRSDYYYFRPGEQIPSNVKNVIKKAEDIYQRVGLVKNVIDLMGDFASQGIRVVHRNKRIEKFYKQWFKKIQGKERSERFLNNIYKTGNIVIDRQTAKIGVKVTNKLYKSLGSPDLSVKDIDDFAIEKKEIPWKYTFIDPVVVEISAGIVASFSTIKRYELLLPAQIRKAINNPKNDAERTVIESLPAALIEAAKSKKGYPLDPNKTIVYHYKKDDWQIWAYPMIYAIMDDITVLEKLKLADMAALDGAISNLRIFKLGSLEHKIAPTKAATAKLAQILGNNVGGGTMDLVWGPDIELIESKTNVHQFLGEGKYIPHLNAVYAGLGIPPTLTGTYGAAGTTNNFISLKTLTQRLMYGRELLTNFWENEIAMVQKAMGFAHPAKIEFDTMDLSNEEAEKALLIQLADRNLISDELLQLRFGMDPDMEKTRLNKESRERKTSRMVNKSGPWHDPQPENSLKKIALQGGMASPSQVGLELGEKKKGEKNLMELKQSLVKPKEPKTNPAENTGNPSIVDEKMPGQPGEGRPMNSKDLEPRKSRKFTPQTGAKLMLWASEAQEKINAAVNPVMLEFYQKKNLRSLSSEQIKELDKLKTKILFSLDPFVSLANDNILEQLSYINDQNILQITHQYSVWLNQLKAELDKELSVEEIKHIKSSFYSNINS